MLCLEYHIHLSGQFWHKSLLKQIGCSLKPIYNSWPQRSNGLKGAVASQMMSFNKLNEMQQK